MLSHHWTDHHPIGHCEICSRIRQAFHDCDRGCLEFDAACLDLLQRPWKHGKPQTECYDSSPLACSS